VWLAREDRVGDDSQPVPGEMLVYLEHRLFDGMDAASARRLAAELLAAAALLR
jgi:hypothetical protein